MRSKLKATAESKEREKYGEVKEQFNTFISIVQEHSGQEITAEGANILIDVAQYLVEREAAVATRYGYKRTWFGYLKEKIVAFNPWLIVKLKRLPNNFEINAFVYGHWDYKIVTDPDKYDIWTRYTKPEYQKIISE